MTSLETYSFQSQPDPEDDHGISTGWGIPSEPEIRNGAWLSERNREGTLAFLKGSGLIYVCVDEPQGFRSSVPPLSEATADIALVRFHGRNKETWEKRGASVAERFKYLYSREELSEWLPKVQALAGQTREVHALFNNCYGDYGVRNARDLRDMVGTLQPALLREPMAME